MSSISRPMPLCACVNEVGGLSILLSRREMDQWLCTGTADLMRVERASVESGALHVLGALHTADGAVVLGAAIGGADNERLVDRT